MVQGCRGHLELPSQVGLAGNIRHQLLTEVTDNNVRRAARPCPQLAQQIPRSLHATYGDQVLYPSELALSVLAHCLQISKLREKVLCGSLQDSLRIVLCICTLFTL